MVLFEGLFTWREEDPRRRIILAPYVFCIQFTCKKLNLALDRIVLATFARKILVLGPKKKKHGSGLSAANGRQFF